MERAAGPLENLDAKLMMALSACRGESVGSEGNWTEYMKAFGGRMYRPDVAPADVVEQENQSSQPVENQSNDAPAVKMVLTNPLFESVAEKRK